MNNSAKKAGESQSHEKGGSHPEERRDLGPAKSFEQFGEYQKRKQNDDNPHTFANFSSPMAENPLKMFFSKIINFGLHL